MNKYITEFIGTFFLVFTVGNVVLGDVGVLGPLAIGSVLMVMIFAGGHISGAHFNPAVTLAVTIRGKCSIADAVPYVVAQCLAGVAAASAAVRLHGSAVEAIDFAAAGVPRVLLVEFLFTFALAHVVLNVATVEATSGNSFYGLAIGFTVLVGAISVGGISGGVFNPAVAVGLVIMKKASWLETWMYFIPQLTGGALAAIVVRLVNGEDAEPIVVVPHRAPS